MSVGTPEQQKVGSAERKEFGDKPGKLLIQDV